jgi:hypothetical protein
MAARLANFVLKFLVVSAVLFLAMRHPTVHGTYMGALAGIIRPLLPGSPEGVALQDRVLNNVVLTALILATPNLTVRRRVTCLGLGLVTLFIVHVVLAYLGCNFVYSSFSNQARSVVDMLMSVSQTALPVGLWIVFTRNALNAFPHGQRPAGVSPGRK